MFEKISTWCDRNRGLIFLLFLSATLKIAAAWATATINKDGVLYITAARHFASGNFTEGLSTYPMPAFPLLIAAAHLLVSDWVATARLVTIFFAVLALIPLYLLTKELFDRRAAFWGCLAFVLAPVPNGIAVEIVRGSPFLFAFVGSVYFAQRAVGSERVMFFVPAAVFALISVLFRVEGWILFPSIVLFLFFVILRESGHRRSYVKGLLVWMGVPVLFVLLFVAAVGPEVSVNRVSWVADKVAGIVKLDFFENYRLVYGQLKELEASAPVPKGKQNLAELARHYMPVLYLFGLLEGLVKAVFPLFAIPLVWGFKRSLTGKTHKLVLLVVGSYLLMFYYWMLARDFLAYRYLSGAAVLLYPWVGRGSERIMDKVGGSSRKTVLTVLFLVFFLVPPVYKNVYYIRKQDNVINRAGAWLAGQEAFHDAEIVSNDMRVFFYAGLDVTELDIWSRKHPNYLRMERWAARNGMDLIIIRVSATKKDAVPEMRVYRKIKEFEGRKNVVFIYRSPAFESRTYSCVMQVFSDINPQRSRSEFSGPMRPRLRGDPVRPLREALPLDYTA